MKTMKKAAILALALMLCLVSAQFSFTTEAVADEEVRIMRYVQPGTLSPQNDEGIAAVNQKLKEDGLNIEVQMIKIPWGEYDQKLNLMLASGEEFELLHVMQDVKNLSAIAGMDAIIPLDEYLDEYPDLYAKFTETEWLGTLYKDQHYAVPCYWKSFDNLLSYMIARTDVMEAVGYDEFPSESVDDLIDLMKKSQDYILEETGLKAYNWFHQTQDTAHWLHRTYDTYPFYVENSLGIVLARQDGTIDSFYESEEFKNDANTYYEMYQAGLIHPDVLNLDHQFKYDQAKLGAFLPSQTFDPNESVVIMQNTDLTDVVTLEYRMAVDKPDMISTFVQNLNAISATASDPRTGLDFLNWLYASDENHDLFHYGIEGVHYNRVENDRIEQVTDESGTALYSQETWMSGYMPYMNYSSDTNDASLAYKVYKSENYVISPIAGFMFDSSNVSTELTNLQTEIISSIYPIKFGMVSYEDNIDAAIANLKAAGLDTYLEEYRRQFNEYLAANSWVLETAAGTTATTTAAE